MTSPDQGRDANVYVDGQGAKAYADAGHGPDGAVLLDPYFTKHIRTLGTGKEMVDIGCGAAPWAIYAVKSGALAVAGYDNSEQMLAQAQQALSAEARDIAGRISLGFGTAKEIPVADETFPVALSSNVGCALPSDDSNEKAKHGTLADHFVEMRRILRPEGFGIVTAPVSLETVFTSRGDEDIKIAEFNDALGHAKDSEAVRQVVGSNSDILRATIIEDGTAFKIASPEEVWVGRKVLRKIPGLVVPNYVHTETEYEAAIADAGLEIIERDKHVLSDEHLSEDFDLGLQYRRRNPFAIYLVQKPA